MTHHTSWPTFQLLKKGRRIEMENQYPNQPDITNLYDGPSDDELKQIEDELDKLTNPL